MHKFFLAALLCANILSAGPAVTYEFSGGRFGDNVLSYLHAKWLAYQHQIPLLYRPFPYSSELIMDAEELNYNAEMSNYKKSILLNDCQPLPLLDTPYLFVCPYFPEIQWELNREKYFTFKPDWKNPEFRKIVNKMISPKHSLSLIYPPQDTLNVAIHLRDGGGFDDYEHHFMHPLKTPPITYYAEAVQRVLSLFNNVKIYCHVFTDALNPKELINQIVCTLPPDAHVVFNYRTQNNRHDANVLEDFFSLFNFDVLIRSESNYSIVPALIHDYVAVVYPETFSIKNRVVTIDSIKININENLYQKTLKKHSN